VPRSFSQFWSEVSRSSSRTLTRGAWSGLEVASTPRLVIPVVSCSKVPRQSWSNSREMVAVVKRGISQTQLTKGFRPWRRFVHAEGALRAKPCASSENGGQHLTPVTNSATFTTPEASDEDLDDLLLEVQRTDWRSGKLQRINIISNNSLIRN
jgi:hypothetical protein